MTNHAIIRQGACVFCVMIAGPLAAQETTFGIEQGLEFSRNPALAVTDEEDRVSALTRLSYGLSSETRIQQFSIGAAGAFRVEDVDGSRESGFEAPTLTFAYGQEGANGTVDISARASQSEIDTLPSLADFVTDGDLTEIPDDFTDLVGTGTRTSYATDASLLIGHDRSVQFRFDLAAYGTRYDDVEDADLVDTRTTRAGLTTALQFSKVTTGSVGLRFSRTEEDDADETERDVRVINLGLTYNATPTTTFTGSLGAEQTITNDLSGEDETEGFVGNAGLILDRPNGTASATLDAVRDVEGDRIVTFRVGRDLELPRGSLSGSVGVTNLENDDTAFVGSLDWTREFPTSLVLLQLSRTVSVDSDADTRERSVASLFYAYQVNPLSDLNIGLTYALAEESDAEAEVERVNLVGAYNYALTEDWDLRAGIGFSQRDEDGVGQADSAQVSLSIGREFGTRR